MKKSTVMYLENSFIARQGLARIIHEHFRSVLNFKSISSKELHEIWPNIDTYDCIIIGSISENTEVIIEKIKKLNKSTRVLIFNVSFDYSQALDYLIAGADGYLTQQAKIDEIVRAIQYALNDRRYLCVELLEQMAQETLEIAIKRKNIAAYDLSATPCANINKLSKRQKQIARLLIRGELVSMIARRLGLGTSTVSTHKSIIFKKLGIGSLNQLVQIYYDDLSC